MGAAVAGDWKGGGGCADVGGVLYHGSIGGTSIWFGDMVRIPVHWEDYGRVTPLGGTKTDEEDSAV